MIIAAREGREVRLLDGIVPFAIFASSRDTTIA